LLFCVAFPNATKKIFKVFNEIEEWLLDTSSTSEGLEKLGVIIHENRFTYYQKGLVKIMDLGEFWERHTGLPIPLGGIVARRSMERSIAEKVDLLIQRSIEYAYKNHAVELSTYVKTHSQEMSEDVMKKHIDLYVNNFSVSLGADGKTAVLKLLDVFKQLHPDGTALQKDIFL
jgi:1,4-dihydroxy-6-naphthoate synthase